MTYKLFLDDLRAPPGPDWVVVRSVAAASEYLKHYGLPLEMSLDHDLGVEGQDAPEFMKLVIDMFLDGAIGREVLDVKLHVHSANPVGVKNLYSRWNSFISFVKESSD